MANYRKIDLPGNPAKGGEVWGFTRERTAGDGNVKEIGLFGAAAVSGTKPEDAEFYGWMGTDEKHILPGKIVVPTGASEATTLRGCFVTAEVRQLTVGIYRMSDGTFSGFRQDGQENPYEDFNYPDAVLTKAFGDNSCLGINERLDVVGACMLLPKGATTASKLVKHGYAILSPGKPVLIDLPGADATVAHAINKHRQIVGHFEVANVKHGFVKYPGEVQGLPRMMELSYQGRPTTLMGINNAGDIVGTYKDGADDRALLIRRDGTQISLDVAIQGEAVQGAVATAINEAGDTIVGYFTDPNYVRHPFIGNGPFA